MLKKELNRKVNYTFRNGVRIEQWNNKTTDKADRRYV